MDKFAALGFKPQITTGVPAVGTPPVTPVTPDAPAAVPSPFAKLGFRPQASTGTPVDTGFKLPSLGDVGAAIQAPFNAAIKGASDAFGTIGAGFNQTVDAASGAGSKAPLSARLQELGRGTLNEAGGAISALTSLPSGFINAIGAIPMPPSLTADGKGGTIGDNIMKNGIQPIADLFASSPALQKFASENPNAPEIAGNLINIALTIAGGEKSGEIKDSLTPATVTPEGLKANDYVNSTAGNMKTAMADPDFAAANAGNTTNPIATVQQNIVDGLPNQVKDVNPAAVAQIKALDPNSFSSIDDFTKVANDIVNNTHAIQTPTTPNAVSYNPQDPKIAAQIKSTADDWRKPTEINQLGYSKVKAALEKDPGTPQFLAEHGANPFSNIEGGKYNTEELAQQFRDTAGKMSSETLRPSLQMADYSTPRTAVDELSTPSIDKAGAGFDVTADDQEAIQANVEKKIAALKRKYPDGMSLENMHDEKITYAKNGGYAPYKAALENNNAIANRAISSSLGEMVEKKAPAGEVDVKALNQHFAKYYRAADYLDALQGKKAPVSFGQQVARGAAGMLGAKAASLIPGFGGDIVSEYAGYRIGKALEYAVENMTNPMRDTFLKNLEITNPPAFQKIADFMGKEKAAQAVRLKLNPGSPLGSAANPRLVGPQTTYEAPAKVINRNN